MNGRAMLLAAVWRAGERGNRQDRFTVESAKMLHNAPKISQAYISQKYRVFRKTLYNGEIQSLDLSYSASGTGLAVPDLNEILFLVGILVKVVLWTHLSWSVFDAHLPNLKKI